MLVQFSHVNLKHYIQQEVASSISLAERYNNMGYGGFIYNFKNTITRPELNRYQDSIERNIIELYEKLETIEGLITTETNRSAIQQLHTCYYSLKCKAEYSNKEKSQFIIFHKS